MCGAEEEYRAGSLRLREEDIEDLSADYDAGVVTIDCNRRLIAYLPHQCSAWRIGGRNELLQLREDIDKALEQIP